MDSLKNSTWPFQNTAFWWLECSGEVEKSVQGPMFKANNPFLCYETRGQGVKGHSFPSPLMPGLGTHLVKPSGEVCLGL